MKVFRKIRQQLAADNNIPKYLRYAIGEIVLVVIGILIALQVNNWNQGRKDNKFEYEILLLIDQNLEQDSLSLSFELSNTKQAIDLTNRLLEQVSLKNYNDSLNTLVG